MNARISSIAGRPPRWKVTPGPQPAADLRSRVPDGFSRAIYPRIGKFRDLHQRYARTAPRSRVEIRHNWSGRQDVRNGRHPLSPREFVQVSQLLLLRPWFADLPHSHRPTLRRPLLVLTPHPSHLGLVRYVMQSGLRRHRLAPVGIGVHAPIMRDKRCHSDVTKGLESPHIATDLQGRFKQVSRSIKTLPDYQTDIRPTSQAEYAGSIPVIGSTEKRF